jgi:hypothetical protein
VDAGALTLNDLVREYRSRYPLPPSARSRVLRKLALCRTPGLGGHLLECNRCDNRTVAWNSCLDRHCPSCMGASAREWVQKQESALLPVPYFHVVFTLPRPLADLALYNKVPLYGLLMRVSAEVLQTIAGDKKYLGGKIGFVSVLHTWSQTLEHHPHVHMVVAGGALCDDGTTWRTSKDNFFLPTRVLAALFRRRFLEEVTRLRDCRLLFQGRVAELQHAEAWAELIGELRKQDWVVYAKPPFGGPEQVVRYLARYTHRVAISNRRIQAFDGDVVTFGVRPSEATRNADALTLPLKAFVDRFLLHLLPQGFTRIRHYGFLAGPHRERNLATIRALLRVAAPSKVDIEDRAPDPCPICTIGTLHRGRDVAPWALVNGQLSNPQKASTGPPEIVWDLGAVLAFARAPAA